MQKKWFKNAIVFVLTLMMIFGNVTPQRVQAASDSDRYTGGYSIESLLTQFQYFTQGDCTLVTHTVGPVAVGGTLTANGITLGEGGHNASYANKLGGTDVPIVTNDGSAYGGTNRDFYYKQNNIANADLTGFTQNNSYMDIANNFSGIVTESEGMVTGAASPDILVVNDPYDPSKGNAIICDFTQNTNYKIEYDDLFEAKNLKLIIGSVEDFKTQKCVINIVGMDDEDFTFDATNGTGWKNSNVINVFLNSDSSTGVGYLKTMSGAVKPNECNINGMKLIFNFPDATGTLKPNNFGGHVVAPLAQVTPIGGNMEGGVIAKTVYTQGSDSAEAHYFPFNNPSTGSLGAAPNNIILVKKFVDSQGNAIPDAELPTEKAKFALYTDAACSNKLTGCESVEAVKGVDGVYRVNISGSNLTLNTTYYLKELTAPSGYTKSDMVYHCIVGADGLVTYKAGNSGAVSSTVPVCENVKNGNASQPAPGTITVIVKDEAGNVISDAVVKVDVTNQDNGNNSEVTIGASGTESLTNQTAGNYKAKLTVPAGYELVSGGAEQTGQLTPGGTLEYVYTLKRSSVSQAGKLTVTVTDESNGERVSDAEVEIAYPGGSKETKVTDSNGEIRLESVSGGDYSVELNKIPEGYKVTTDKKLYKTVVPGAETVFEFKIGIADESQLGNLVIVVTDERTGARVPRARLRITGPANYNSTAVTNESGEAAVYRLRPGDYTVTITEVPEGYTVTTNREIVKLVAARQTTNFEYMVNQFGGLSIVVLDEKTGARVPNAELVITGPGNFSKQGRTDSNGEVKFTDLEPGEYTVKITRVPEGYFVTTESEFKKTVVTNASTYYEFKVDKPADSDTDDNTNNDSDNDNTDNNNTDNNNTNNNTNNNNNNNDTNNNTNTNTGSGSAGTNTDSNNQNVTNAVQRENVAPKTNDTSYMLLAIIMLFIAGIGLCAISIYKMKNKDI